MSGLLIHEWIERIGGAERVLDEFAGLFPDAGIFCLWNDAPDRYAAGRVRESVLARTPLRGRKAAALPVMPAVWRSLREEHEWMLVSSHLFAHHARVPGVAPDRTFVYAHTPARYLWAPELDARGASLPVRAVAPVFRALDAHRGGRLQHVAANSRFVRDRIRAAWGVEATVIHPPVAVERLQSIPDRTAALTVEEAAVVEALPAVYVLGASRFVPYKGLTTVIDAAAANGLPAVIAGGGPSERLLRAYAAARRVDVRFVLSPSDHLLAALLQRALVFVFPPVEDFGILPVEAMAVGTPVIVNARGGAAESVLDGRTGVLVRRFDPATLVRAVETAAALSPDDCRDRARSFGSATFRASIRAWMAGVASPDPTLIGEPR